MFDYGVDNVDKVIHSFHSPLAIKKNNRKEKQAIFPYRKNGLLPFAAQTLRKKIEICCRNE